MSTVNKPAKRPVGRPSKYKPEFCEMIVNLAKTGAGWAEWALACEADRASLFRWAEEHEDFRTALSCAKLEEQAWWEKEGRAGMRAEKFNALVWKVSMQARFRDDYTERQATEVSGPNGGAIKVESKTVDSKALSQEQRDALREILLAAKAGKK